MNILPFAGIAAIILLKKQDQGSFANGGDDRYSKRTVVTPDLIRRTGLIMKRMKQLNIVKVGSHRIINLTPHEIDLKLKDGSFFTIPKSGGYLRVKVFNSKEEAFGFDEMDVRLPDQSIVNIHFRPESRNGRPSYGKFPPPNILNKDPYFDDVWFLVSRITATYLNKYPNILTVSNLKKDAPYQNNLMIAENLCID